MPDPKILFINRIGHVSLWDPILEETKKRLCLIDLPKAVSASKADLAFRELKGIDAVVLRTLRLSGKDRRLQRVYKIPGVRVGNDINYHQGLATFNMPGISFIGELKTRKIKCGLVADIHPDVGSFLYDELDIGFVYSAGTRNEDIIHALRNMLYPSKY